MAQTGGSDALERDAAESKVDQRLVDRKLNDQLVALTQALGRSPDPERLMRKMLGRAPRPKNAIYSTKCSGERMRPRRSSFYLSTGRRG